MDDVFPFIKSVTIENFMSIKYAVLEFDDSNILNLCGYNDSGKSAVTRLFEIMLYDAYPTECVKYIHDGESYWRGTILFADGVTYERMKSSDGSSVWELRRGDSLLFTNRLDTGVSAIGGIPDVISTYLGVASDAATGEYLNVRRNTDKLLLVGTSGGDNYKILNSILKSEQLATASRMLNEDTRALETELKADETRLSVLSERCDGMVLASDTVLVELSSMAAAVRGLAAQCSQLEALCGLASQVNGIRSEPVLAMEIPVPVDVSAVSELEALRQLRDKMASYHVSTEVIPDPVDLSGIELLVSALEKRDTISRVTQELSECSTSLKLSQTSLSSLAVEGRLTLCPNCGTFIEGGAHIGC